MSFVTYIQSVGIGEHEKKPTYLCRGQVFEVGRMDERYLLALCVTRVPSLSLSLFLSQVERGGSKEGK